MGDETYSINLISDSMADIWYIYSMIKIHLFSNCLLSVSLIRAICPINMTVVWAKSVPYVSPAVRPIPNVTHGVGVNNCSGRPASESQNSKSRTSVSAVDEPRKPGIYG